MSSQVSRSESSPVRRGPIVDNVNHHDDGKSAVQDAGNKPNDHYKSKLSPVRYHLRQACLPIIRWETEVLAKFQASIRHPVLDFYFAWTANLASHTFYVLMLPLPAWLGASTLLRDLVHVLGLGIYISGYLKDFLCLPRPRSPPLHRITMSSYTTQEYGFPSSHSANATAVTFIVLAKIFELRDSFCATTFYALVAAMIVYYVSLIFGRIYCGMHGFFDIMTGSLIGFGLFLFRWCYGAQFDNFVFDNSLPTPVVVVLIIAFYVYLVHIHAEPVDDCPCFDDSVAFIGVIIGLDISHLLFFRSKYLLGPDLIGDSIAIQYDFAKFGFAYTLLRAILGVALVVVWKAFSKPVIFTILPPVYKFIGVNLPRRNYEATAFTERSTRHIRSTSISNIDSGKDIANIQDFIKGVTDHSKKDQMGPQTDIDYYELLDYQRQKHVPITAKPPIGVFRPRYDVEIVGRLIVYAGVPTAATWGFAIATRLAGLA